MNGMKYILLLALLTSGGSVLAQNSGQKQADLPALTKTPRSLFLIKKAKIDNDVGEPVLYPSEKQAELLTNEKIYNKYRLQILDTHNADWNSDQ